LGSGSRVKGISLQDPKKIAFLKPPLAEQTAIAAALSHMDAEIEALEARREKARQIKQGMMQEFREDGAGVSGLPATNDVLILLFWQVGRRIG
jgi:hypothetical protein